MSVGERHEWWQTGLIYEIYPRSFKDSTGNGVGDLLGIVDKMDYLSDTLGIDAIWIGPFYPSPMADFGYDVSDYCGVDPLFGDLATFDRLVARAHDAGIKVIVDFVINHTSDQHPWFVESRGSRDNARREWYVWRDPKPGGSPPNNWLSVFGGSAWELDERTGQYYLHSFLKEQPDLNWRNDTLKAAMFDNLRFWLDRGIDGFRIDAAHYIMKDPAERDNPANVEGTVHAHRSFGAYDLQVHLYDKGHAEVHRVFRELRSLLEEYEPPRMALGEIHIFDWNELGSYYGEDLDGLHMPANFGLLKAPWTAAGIRGAVDGIESSIPPGAWPNFVLGNHDEPRLATRLGEAASRQAAVLLITLRGTPFLYYGDELGLRETEIPVDQQRDPWGKAHPGLGRDGGRTPMPWAPVEHAGFTTADEPWLPVATDYPVRNVQSQLGDPDSHLNLYRRLIAMRRGSDALTIGSYRPMDSAPSSCFVFERAYRDERVLVAINFSAGPVSVAIAKRFRRVAVSTHRRREGSEVNGTLDLEPHEALVVV